MYTNNLYILYKYILYKSNIALLENEVLDANSVQYKEIIFQFYCEVFLT